MDIDPFHQLGLDQRLIQKPGRGCAYIGNGSPDITLIVHIALHNKFCHRILKYTRPGNKAIESAPPIADFQDGRGVEIGTCGHYIARVKLYNYTWPIMFRVAN